MKNKEIKFKVLSGEGFDGWVSFDKKTFELLQSANKGLAEELLDKDKTIEELKQQLAEKDKMIRFYEGQLLPEYKVSLTKEFANFDRKQQARIRELEIRCQQQEQEIEILAKNQIQNLNHDIETRHQVCDEIREAFLTELQLPNEEWVWHSDNYAGVSLIKEILDQVEGENDDK